jgi:hypothetical protein
MGGRGAMRNHPGGGGNGTRLTQQMIGQWSGSNGNRCYFYPLFFLASSQLKVEGVIGQKWRRRWNSRLRCCCCCVSFSLPCTTTCNPRTCATRHALENLCDVLDILAKLLGGGGRGSWGSQTIEACSNFLFFLESFSFLFSCFSLEDVTSESLWRW